MRFVPTTIVEPNPLLREGLSRILQGTRFRLLHAAPKIDALNRSPPNSLCILRAHEGRGAADVAGQIHRIKKEICRGRLAVLGSLCEFSNVLAALRAGANGYLISTISCDALLKSLELIMLDETVISSDFLKPLSENSSLTENSEGTLVQDSTAVSRHRISEELGRMISDKFTGSFDPSQTACRSEFTMEVVGRHFSSRELAILRCLMNGASNKMIARELEIAESTVKVHVKGILRKIQVRNRTQAAIWAMNCPVRGQERN